MCVCVCVCECVSVTMGVIKPSMVLIYGRLWNCLLELVEENEKTYKL